MAGPCKARNPPALAWIPATTVFYRVNARADSLPSPWLEEVELDYAPPLLGEHSADLAVVGGGLTGLSAALEMAQTGASVALLEAETSGFGASARNAGHLTPTIGKDVPTLLRLFGADKTARLLAYSDAAILHVESLISQHAIACDYEAVGNVVAAVDSRQYGAIDRASAAAADNGLPGCLLDGAEMSKRGLPASFTRGFFEANGGVLNPALYCRGLRQAALEAGVVVFDQSRVAGIDDSRPTAVVHSERGRLKAGRVVLATNAYTPALFSRGSGRPPVSGARLSGARSLGLGSSGLRLQVQLFRTAPLSDSQLSRLPWTGREGIYTAHEALESYRLTADNRILGGAKWVRYGFNNRALADVNGRVAEGLERVFRERFPELDDVDVERHWGGPIFLAMDFLPRVGSGGRHGNIFHSLAYAGHGLAHASYAGKVLADMLAGDNGPGSVLWQRRSMPTPPEPLRWLIFQALNGVLALIDKKADRKAADRRS